MPSTRKQADRSDRRTPWSSLLVGAALAAGSWGDARADEPPARASDGAAPPAEAAPVTAAAEAGLDVTAISAYASPPVNGALTALGIGFGAGAALVVHHVSIGIELVDYLGAKDDAGSSEHALTYGAHLGYELRLGSVVSLRPAMTIGGASISHSVDTSAAGAGPTPSTGQTAARGSNAPDVVTQASSANLGGRGGGGGSTSTTSTTVQAYYVGPCLTTMLWISPNAYVGLAASVLVFPNVPYSYDSSATWLSYSGRGSLTYRF